MQLSEKVSRLVRLEADDYLAFADLDRYNAPSECYSLIGKGREKEREILDYEKVMDEAEERCGKSFHRYFEKGVGRILWRETIE